MNKFLLSVAFIIVIPFYANAQKDITPRLVYSDTTSFNFTTEWQYLSTDIYLFNAPQFAKLINELNVTRKGRKRRRRKSKLEREKLEYLFISAKLKNVSFFGNQDITYPLYNFQAQQGDKEHFAKYVNKQIDHIRIIDNLPLYTAKDYIDAEIDVKAITDSNSDQLIRLIAQQLQNISNITNPSKALLSIVGEFGNFMENSSQKREYHFSSSIRLFEQNNFDTRLHSIKIYELNTNKSHPVKLDRERMHAFFAGKKNPSINRERLDSVINYKRYPLLVVANYKSLYRMEEVSGDEITFAAIEKRKLKIESDFRSGLINTETYRQEKDFIAFITLFAHLKSNLEMYNLNYKTGNGDAIYLSLYKVLQFYKQIVDQFKQIEFKYKKNSTYRMVFRSEYKSILGFTNLYLENDHNLKSAKDMINSLSKLEETNISKLDSMSTENFLRDIRFIDVFPENEIKKSSTGQTIVKYVEILEQNHYNKFFKSDLYQLESKHAEPKNNIFRDKIQEKINKTNCVLCREEGKIVISEYNKNLSEFTKKVLLIKKDSLLQEVENKMFDYWDRRDILKANFDIVERDSVIPQSIKLLKKKYLEIVRDIENLNSLIKIDVDNKEIEIIKEYINKLNTLPRNIDRNLSFICNKKEELCKKIEVKQVPKVKTDIDTIVKNDKFGIADTTKLR